MSEDGAQPSNGDQAVCDSRFLSVCILIHLQFLPIASNFEKLAPS